jgi:predicted glycosyltransferase involved in capsule biosynthesis
LQNEKFIGWGAEDDEFIFRAKFLGLQFGNIPGVLYHLIHPIPNNSRFKNPFYRANMDEYNKVMKMTKEQLKEYIRKE